MQPIIKFSDSGEIFSAQQILDPAAVERRRKVGVAKRPAEGQFSEFDLQKKQVFFQLISPIVKRPLLLIKRRASDEQFRAIAHFRNDGQILDG